MTEKKLTANTPWFYIKDDVFAQAHRAAYEKSLKSRHAVKIRGGHEWFTGFYYYRGFSVDHAGTKALPWMCYPIGGTKEDLWFARTKKQAMADIDDILSKEAEQHETT